MNSEWTGDLEFRLRGEASDGSGGRQLLCEGPFQSQVLIRLYRTREGHWSWEWQERWLDHTTRSEPRMSWLHREHAVDALRRAAVLYRVSGLADYFAAWR